MLTFSMSPGAVAQVNPTPFFTSFADTLYASTYNGQPLAVGSIIQAYDPTGVYCGVDTVRVYPNSLTSFGYFSVYGDDSETIEIDEGATDGEQITFKVNGRTATVTAGDDTWTDLTLKSVTLSATATVALTGLGLPNDTLIMPGDTGTFGVQVRNDGDGIDFYGVQVSMSQVGGTGPFDWQAFEPDTAVYADPAEAAWVYFSVKAPLFAADTVNTITYTVYSHLDNSVTLAGSFDLIMSLTDVEDGDNPALPGSFTLFQNYPNPFNPTTRIGYRLAVGSSARLEIVDMLGRTVESRELGWLSAGEGEIVYDASALASGVYFYRLSTETAAQTRKMILLK